MLFTKQFWMDALERIVSTMAQTAVALMGANALISDFRLSGVHILDATAGAGIACLVKCLAATRVGASNTASLLPAGPDTEQGHADVSVALIAVLVTILTIVVMKVLGLI